VGEVFLIQHKKLTDNHAAAFPKHSGLLLTIKIRKTLKALESDTRRCQTALLITTAASARTPPA
jgi:hypothetical protein